MNDPTYTCWKCGRGSWASGGRPVCCHCGAKAKLLPNGGLSGFEESNDVPSHELGPSFVAKEDGGTGPSKSSRGG